MQQTSAPVEFKKHREFGDIINDTFMFIRQNLKPLLRVFIYLCGFFVLATVGSTIMQQISSQKLIATAGQYDSGRVFARMFTFQYLLVFAFGLLNYSAMTVSILGYIVLYIEKGNIAPTVEEVWAYFKYYYMRVLSSSVVVSIFLLVCFLCCLIPGIYVFPAMSIFFPVMIMENASLSYSFSRSFNLLKGEYWTSAGAIFIIWIITYAATTFTSLPAIAVTFFSAFTSATHTLSTGTIIFSSIMQALAQVFMIIPLVGATLCYFNLVEHKDNTGLMDRLSQMGQKKEGLSNEEY